MADRIKVEYYEAYGPFCGTGGYGGGLGVAINKSPKVALRLARERHNRLPQGGGVPILFGVRISKNGKIIAQRGDNVFE